MVDLVTNLGRDYVEEVKGFTGVKYRCNLCHVNLEHTTKEAHIKESKHKELYKVGICVAVMSLT